MPRPAKPVPGAEIRHDDFGQPVVAYAGENLRFVRNRQSIATAVSNSAGITTPTELELTQLPANNPKVKYAMVTLLVRGNGNDNYTMQVYAPDGTTVCGSAYTSGTTVGGDGGPYMVPVGGTNGRSVKWSALHTSAKCWMYVFGWWESVG